MAFTEAIALALKGAALQADLLVHMDFRDSPIRFWTGWGMLEAAGHTWKGLGQLVSIEGLQQATGTVAPETTFTLSGVDPDIVALTAAASDRAVGRRVRVWMQIFSVDGGDTPVDEPFVIWTGTMDRPRFTAEGSGLRQVSITANNLMTRRNSPPHGMYTDRDQQARYPGDKGLERIPELVSKQVRWEPET